MKEKFLFASESVSEGHPDKMADQISDAILDEYLKNDPESKVACECILTNKQAFIAGEIYSRADLKKKIPGIVRKVIREIGYDHNSGYEAEKIRISNFLHEQAGEIRAGVEKGGAGDQGVMFGYACNETPVLMPYAVFLAHRIMERQAELRKSGQIPWLLPDAKSQVTVIYEDGKIAGIDNIIVSTQHMPIINSPENFWKAKSENSLKEILILLPVGSFQDYSCRDRFIEKLPFMVTSGENCPGFPGRIPIWQKKFHHYNRIAKLQIK